MKVEASAVYAQPRDVVWSKLMDFDVLGRSLPGIQEMTPLTPEKCEMKLKVLVPAITGKYAGTVEIAEKHPLDTFRLMGRATGRLGWVRGDAEFRLSDDTEGTRVDAAMDFATGGLLSSVGARFMEAIAQGMTREFFANFGKELLGELSVVPQPQSAS